MTPAVLLLSGGMDSGVLLRYALELQYFPIRCLSFNYGSKHAEKELAKAIHLANIYHCPHTVIALPFMNNLFTSSLLQSGGDIPEGHYEDSSMKSTVVPYRNGILLSIAVGLAESLKYPEVLIAAHSGDHAIYPDCRFEFINAACIAAGLGTYNHISISAPFLYMTKKDIADIGRSLDFDFTNTYSCYKGNDIHCGKCGTCTERKEALGYSQDLDPTTYEA
jgi:7-cyano-7-deazaguanine synthase